MMWKSFVPLSCFSPPPLDVPSVVSTAYRYIAVVRASTKVRYLPTSLLDGFFGFSFVPLVSFSPRASSAAPLYKCLLKIPPVSPRGFHFFPPSNFFSFLALFPIAPRALVSVPFRMWSTVCVRSSRNCFFSAQRFFSLSPAVDGPDRWLLLFVMFLFPRAMLGEMFLFLQRIFKEFGTVLGNTFRGDLV